MFAVAQGIIRRQLNTGDNDNIKYESLHARLEDLPRKYTFQQLHSHLVVSSSESDARHLESLIILSQCLQRPENFASESGDLECAKLLLLWTSTLVRPCRTSIAQDKVPDDEDETIRIDAAERLRFKSEICIKIIHNILCRLDMQDDDLDFSVLLNLLAFTDARDLWTSSTTLATVLEILHSHVKQIQTRDFIIDYSLSGFIRPLFSMSKPTTITSQGRKAVYPIAGSSHQHEDLNPSNKPWKFQELSAITIFRWLVNNSDEYMLYQSWHLFVPPILTLLDDPSTRIRVSGLEILQMLLKKTPAKILQQTGLDEVFEDVVMPTLMFLPSLTPVEESISLLTQAYETLFLLGDVCFPTMGDRPGKVRLLDRVMRQGILQGFDHSYDNVKIVEVLLQEIDKLMCRLGIHAVKHVKDVIPILNRTLADPFGPSRPRSLLLAVKVTQSTILNCWPSMGQAVHRLEILQSLCLCWTNVNEDYVSYSSKHKLELDVVQKELKLAVVMLVKSVEELTDVNIRNELIALLDIDEEFGDLFGLGEYTARHYGSVSELSICEL